jgi:hypothetical protein
MPKIVDVLNEAIKYQNVQTKTNSDVYEFISKCEAFKGLSKCDQKFAIRKLAKRFKVPMEVILLWYECNYGN